MHGKPPERLWGRREQVKAVRHREQSAEGPERVRCGLRLGQGGRGEAGQGAVGARGKLGARAGRNCRRVPGRCGKEAPGVSSDHRGPRGQRGLWLTRSSADPGGLRAHAGGTRLRSQLQWAGTPWVCRSAGRPRVGGRARGLGPGAASPLSLPGRLRDWGSGPAHGRGWAARGESGVWTRLPWPWDALAVGGSRRRLLDEF